MSRCSPVQTKPDYTCSRKITRVTEIRSGILTNVNWDSAIRQSFGLTAWDVIPSAWDLIPLSFVVDRFYHIGDWLNYQARRFNPNVEILSSWRTETVRTVTEDAIDIHPFDFACPVANHFAFHRSGSVGKSFYDTETVTRTPGLYVPALPVLELPESISTLHTLDYLALGYQASAHKLSQLRRKLRL